MTLQKSSQSNKVHLLHDSDKFVRLKQKEMSELPGFLECHKEYSYLGPGGAKKKVEWVSKTMLIRKPLSLNILTLRRKTSIVSLKHTMYVCKQ